MTSSPTAAGPDVSGRLEKPKVSFKDVGGMDAIKEEIQLKIIHPLQHPELAMQPRQK